MLRKTHYELRHAGNNSYLADMIMSSSNNSRSFSEIGDELPLEDSTIHKNNSRRLRICLIEGVSEKIKGKVVLYLRPTEKEYKPFGRIIASEIDIKDKYGNDWSGSDGWLKIS